MSAKFVEIEGWEFDVADVRVIHRYESKTRPTDLVASGFHLEVVLKDVPGQVVFKFTTREKRDEVRDLIKKLKG